MKTLRDTNISLWLPKQAGVIKQRPGLAHLYPTCWKCNRMGQDDSIEYYGIGDQGDTWVEILAGCSHQMPKEDPANIPKREYQALRVTITDGEWRHVPLEQQTEFIKNLVFFDDKDDV